MLRSSAFRQLNQSGAFARLGVASACLHCSCRLWSKDSAKAQNFFDLFPRSLSAGMPPHGPFLVDKAELRREFLQLQAVAHPDRHPQSSKLKAEATSAFINEAFRTLLDPLLRAQYLLSLRGISTQEDETAKIEDPELLMEVLEAREQIEDAHDEQELSTLRNENDERVCTSVTRLSDAFAADDIDAAGKEVIKLRYWCGINERIKDRSFA